MRANRLASGRFRGSRLFPFWGGVALAGSVAGASVLDRDVVIVAYGQSNEAGFSIDGQTIEATDQDASGVIVELPLGASSVRACVQPMAWPISGNHGPSRSFALAQGLLPNLAPGRSIVIIPAAASGRAMVGGPLGEPTGSNFTPAKAALTTALGLYPGALCLMSFTQGETDGAELASQSEYQAEFAAVMANLRSVPGAEDMNGLIHQINPDTFDAVPGRRAIDAAHKEIPLVVPNTYFIGTERGLGITGDVVHFVAQAHRDAGTRAAALYQFAGLLSEGAPLAPSAPVPVGFDLRITVSNPNAPAYVVQHRAAGSSDPWVDQVVHCPHWVAPGGTFDVTVAGHGDRDVRVFARSYGGDSAATAPVTLVAPWIVEAGNGQATITRSPATPSIPTILAGDGSATVE